MTRSLSSGRSALGQAEDIHVPGDYDGDGKDNLAVAECTGSRGTYERLPGDAMAGDTTLFARQDVVEAAWQVVDPILAVDDDGAAVHEYHAGSWAPEAAEVLTTDLGGWNTPT